MSAAELEGFARALAWRPELWIEHVRHDESQRSYEELFGDEHVTAWLICWMRDHDTGFHDHDLSSGAVAVLSGAVREERLAIRRPTLQIASSAPAVASTSPPPTSIAFVMPAVIRP